MESSRLSVYLQRASVVRWVQYQKYVVQPVCNRAVAVSSEQWKASTAATPCAAQAVLLYLWWGFFPHLSQSWWSPLSPHSLFRPTCQQISIQTPPTPTNHSSITATPIYIPVRERETPQSWTTPPVSIHAEASHPPVSRVTFSTSVETRHEPACFKASTITPVLSPSSPPLLPSGAQGQRLMAAWHLFHRGGDSLQTAFSSRPCMPPGHEAGNKHGSCPSCIGHRGFESYNVPKIIFAHPNDVYIRAVISVISNERRRNRFVRLL